MFDLALGAFADAPMTFSRDVQSACPRFPGSLQIPKPDELFVDKLPAEIENVVEASDEIESWIAVVRQLAERVAFQDEQAFYYVRGLRSPEKSELKLCKNDALEVIGGADYELSIIHFSPSTKPVRSDDVVWLMFEARDSEITFISYPRLRLDSAYDEKLVRFCVPPVDVTKSSVITLLEGAGPPSKPVIADGFHHFDIRVTVKPRQLLRWVKVILLAGLISAQSLATSEWVPDTLRLVSIFASAVIIAVVAVFGIRKAV
ncbi:MAG: hypothetical protein WD081_09155 [Gammaproteobacteria bacterium]